MKNKLSFVAFGFVAGLTVLPAFAVDRLTAFDVLIDGSKFVFDEKLCQLVPKKPEVFEESVSYQLFNPSKLTFLRSGKEIRLVYRLNNAVFSQGLSHTSLKHTSHDYTEYKPGTVSIELVDGGRKGDSHVEYRISSATKIAEVAIIYSSDRFTLKFKAESKPNPDQQSSRSYPTMTARVVGKKNHDELTVSIGPRAKCQNEIPEDALGYEPERPMPSMIPADANPFAPPSVKEDRAPAVKKPAKPAQKPSRKSKSKGEDESPVSPGLSKEQTERVREAQQRLRELFERMRQRRSQQENGMDSDE